MEINATQPCPLPETGEEGVQNVQPNGWSTTKKVIVVAVSCILSAAVIWGGIELILLSPRGGRLL